LGALETQVGLIVEFQPRLKSDAGHELEFSQSDLNSLSFGCKARKTAYFPIDRVDFEFQMHNSPRDFFYCPPVLF